MGHQLLTPYRRKLPWHENFVNNTISLSFVRRHPEVPFGVFLDGREILTGVVDEDVIQLEPQANDFLGLDLDVGHLTLDSAVRLVKHDACVWERKALAGSTGGHEHRRRRGGLAHAEGGHVGLDVLDGVLHGEERRNDAAW